MEYAVISFHNRNVQRILRGLSRVPEAVEVFLENEVVVGLTGRAGQKRQPVPSISLQSFHLHSTMGEKNGCSYCHYTPGREYPERQI